MESRAAATTLAEGQYEFKTDVNLIFGNERLQRTYVLRTTMHSLSVWKTRNPSIGLSPFKDRSAAVTKEASVIEGEVWVFGINATVSQDIVAAVKLASLYFNIKPSAILNDIYTKNLNSDGEHENDMANQALVRANKDLYTNVCTALTDAAKQLGISNQLNLYVFSKNTNPKIPQSDLADALKSGGASSVTTDANMHRVKIGNNQNTAYIPQSTNLHLATLKV